MEKRRNIKEQLDAKSIVLENQRYIERRLRADEVRQLLRSNFQKITVINDMFTPFDYARGPSRKR